MRVMEKNADDRAFVDFLLRIGEGKEPTVQTKDYSSYIRIPDDILFTPVGPSINNSHERQLIKAIYFPNSSSTTATTPTRAVLQDSIILAPRNSDVDLLNRLATAMLPGGPPTIFRSQDTIPDSDSEAAAQFPTEVLNSFELPGMPPHLLELKVGQPIILLRNVDSIQGLCNGTRLIITRLGRKYIQASILNGNRMGQVVAIPRIPIVSPEDGTLPVVFERRQFPVKPAFAITINKSQGQTLQSVGVYLPQPVFTHGQLYVALSRCSSRNKTKVLIRNGALPDFPGTYTKNIVYREALK